METIIKSNYANVEEVNVTKFINEVKADANNNYRHTITVVGDQFGKVLQALQAHGAKVCKSYTNDNNEPHLPEGVTSTQVMSINGWLNRLNNEGEVSLEISQWCKTCFVYKNRVYVWDKNLGYISLYNSVLYKMPYRYRELFRFDEKEPNRMFKANLRAMERWAEYLDRKEQAAKELIERYNNVEQRLLDELDKAGVKYEKSGDREYTLYCGIHKQKVYIDDKGAAFYTPEVDYCAYHKLADKFNGEFGRLELLTKLAAV